MGRTLLGVILLGVILLGVMLLGVILLVVILQALRLVRAPPQVAALPLAVALQPAEVHLLAAVLLPVEVPPNLNPYPYPSQAAPPTPQAVRSQADGNIKGRSHSHPASPALRQEA